MITLHDIYCWRDTVHNREQGPLYTGLRPALGISMHYDLYGCISIQTFTVSPILCFCLQIKGLVITYILTHMEYTVAQSE